jgi:hypothetical protein
LVLTPSPYQQERPPFNFNQWDIDLIISRTLVYGVLTAVIIALYAVVGGGMAALFQTQANWLLALIATGIVAVLFQLLRDHLQRRVNRLLYGQRDEPFEPQVVDRAQTALRARDVGLV